jgi:N,N'-diacetyllegionaminate synthase
MSIHALIPARKNSKRLPAKHLRILGRVPLIDWTLAAAEASGVFDQICLSTDDPVVQNRGRHFGCMNFPLRPDHLCTDEASSADVVRHYLDFLEFSGKPLPDRIALLQATSPFRGAARIREAVEKSTSTSLVSVGPVWKPATWNRLIRDEHCLAEDPPASATHCLNGAIYILSVKEFLETGELVPAKPLALQMEPWESLDIDEPLDWLLAEGVASHLDNRGYFLDDEPCSSGGPCTVPNEAVLEYELPGNEVHTLVAQAAPFIIAEIGVNHNGSLAQGLDLIRMAARCGADAVKFQLFQAASLARPNAPMAAYQKKSMESSTTQQSMLRTLETSLKDLQAYQAEATRLDLRFGCTPFDPASLDALGKMKPDFIKISSGDANNLPLLKQAASTQFPVIVSTGMCTMPEVQTIRDLFRENPGQLALLHCVSSYPAPLEECNLRALTSLQKGAALIGFSDHTLGCDASLAAVALDAKILEKHITSDCSAVGPDHAASMDEVAFLDYVLRVRTLAGGLGNGVKTCMPCESDVASVARKSIVLKRDLLAGDRLSSEDLTCLRPADGLAPTEFFKILGSTLANDLASGSVLTSDDLLRASQ